MITATEAKRNFTDCRVTEELEKLNSLIALVSPKAKKLSLVVFGPIEDFGQALLVARFWPHFPGLSDDAVKALEANDYKVTTINTASKRSWNIEW